MKKAETISILAASVRPREAKDRARYDEAVRMAIEALKCSETPKSSERTSETAQVDHNADVSKKVEQTVEIAQNVQNGDLISRKWLVECIEEGWVKFDTAKDCNRMMHLVRDIAPSAQPVLTCKGCRYDGYYKHMQCRNCLRKERDLYEPE